MAKSIWLEVVTPDRSVVSEEAQIVMAPGAEGEFGVLSGHTPFLSTLKVGAVKYKDTSGRERWVFVSGGFAEALPEKMTILAESAERRSDIDLERAKTALKRAQERLEAERKDELEFVRARAALERALERLRLAEGRSRS